MDLITNRSVLLEITTQAALPATHFKTMKTIVLFCVILGVALGAPSGGYVQYPAYYAPQVEKATGPIITGTLHHSQDTYGQYKYGYTSSDGQNKEETRNTEGAVDGKFRYTSPEGQQIELSYESGKDGFQAIGDHLPQAPELPEELATAFKISNDRLAQAYEEARLRGDNENTDGAYTPEKYEVPAAPAPAPFAPTYQAPIYQVPAAPAAPAYTATYVRKEIKNPSYPTNTYYAVPAQVQVKEAEKPKAPVPYVASSYSTEIGGVPITITVKTPTQSEEVPKISYAYQPGHY